MWDAGRCDDDRSGFRDLLLVADAETATACEHEVKLIRACVCVDWLHLARFEAIQADHHVLALP